MTSRKKFTKVFFSTLLLSLAACSFLLVLAPHKASAYANNELIDDSIYLDSRAMSQAQIQAFLVGKGSYLANYISYSGRDAGNAYAAQIIYEAAQDYGINPQVILATLQKEEGLITDQNPSSGQLNFAMGYGCSDSSGCSKWTGFYNQVDNATWQFRFNYERTNGNNSWWNPSLSYPCNGPTRYYTAALRPGNNVGFIDDYGTVYTSFVIANPSTASLYCYTPHAYPGSSRQYFSGSYNFVINFEAWFGSTVGDLVRTVDNPTVFLISGGYKYPIGDSSVFGDFSPLGPVRFVSNDTLSIKTTGPLLGHMVGQSNGTLYFVNAGMKLAFPTCGMVADYGYTCDSIPYLTDAQLSKLATGPLLTPYYKTTSSRYFYINGGQRREVFDNTSLSLIGLGGPANTLLDGGVSYLPYGAPVIRPGVVVNNRSSGLQYLMEQGTFYLLQPDIASLAAINNLPHGSFDNNSIPENLRSSSFKGYIQNSTATTKYILLQSGKATLSSPGTWTASFTTVSDSLLAAIPNSAEPINNYLIKSPTDATVYYLTSAGKRPVAGWDSLVSLGISPLYITNVQGSTINQITNGPTFYGIGNMIKSANSPTVYIVKSATELLPISSFLYPQELGVPMSMKIISQSDLQTYSSSSTVQTKVLCGSTYYVGTNGKLFDVTATLSLYGFQASEFVNAGTLCSVLPKSAQPLGNFIRVNNGTIYYVSAGQKQAFTSYGAYLAHGGNAATTIQVSDYFASLLVSGQNITQ